MVKLRGLKVLIVEDEALLMMMVEDMIVELGCNFFVAASNIQQAVEYIEREPFDLCLLDINLNGERSDPVAVALDAHRIPFLFCTGNSIIDVPPLFSDHPVLSKPFATKDLIFAIKKLHLPSKYK